MNKKPELLIDNTCAFCSKSMEFIVRNGGEDKFRFLSLYSDEGKQKLLENGFPENYDKSLVLIENENAYIKSDAALRVSKKLKGIWPVFYFFRFVPKKLRDAVYDFISRHRHKIYK